MSISKTSLFSAAVIASFTAAEASATVILDDPDSADFVLTTTDGQHHRLKGFVKEITFTDTHLTATGSDGTAVTLPLDQMLCMGMGTPGRSGITAPEAGPAVRPVDVYLPDGTFRGRFGSVEAARGGLPAGFYVIRLADGSTLKTAVI